MSFSESVRRVRSVDQKDADALVDSNTVGDGSQPRTRNGNLPDRRDRNNAQRVGTEPCERPALALISWSFAGNTSKRLKHPIKRRRSVRASRSIPEPSGPVTPLHSERIYALLSLSPRGIWEGERPHEIDCKTEIEHSNQGVYIY